MMAYTSAMRRMAGIQLGCRNNILLAFKSRSLSSSTSTTAAFSVSSSSSSSSAIFASSLRVTDSFRISQSASTGASLSSWGEIANSLSSHKVEVVVPTSISDNNNINNNTNNNNNSSGLDQLETLETDEEGLPIIALECPAEVETDPILAMNRNAREPRKANHGARPCSNVRRKRKLRKRANEHPYIPDKKKKGYDI